MNDDHGSVSQRIALLRFLMIFGVVLLHAPPYVPIAEVANTPFDLLKAFFQNAVFRTSVSLLACISGYLLFRSALDRTPAKLASRKFRTLVVPFLVFNLGLLTAALVMQVGLGVTLNNDLVPKGRNGWLDAAIGLTNSPINYPLNFLRDLIALMIAAPLLGWFMRNFPLLGLGIVLAIYRFDLDGPFVLRNALWPMFYLGGLAAIRGWDMRALDRYASLCLALFLLLCAYIIAFRVANTDILRMVAPFLIWPASSLLVRTPFGLWLSRMNKYSFFLFLAHAPVLLLTSIVYKPFKGHIPYPFYWVLGPVVTTAVLVVVYKLAMRMMPRLFRAAIGAKPVSTTSGPNHSASIKADQEQSGKKPLVWL